MQIRGLVFAVALCASAFLVPSLALACGCTPVIDRPMLTPLAEVREQLASADQVFLGRVLARSDTSITFAAEAYWKGSGSAQQTLVGGMALPDGSLVISDCDFGFESDAQYVVFANHGPRGLAASSCSMTRRIDQAVTLISLLDRAAPRQVVRPQLAE